MTDSKPHIKPDIKTLLGLSCFGKIGPRGFAKLTADNISLKNLTASRFTKAGIKENIASEWSQFIEKFDVDYELEQLQNQKISLITSNDEAYPPLLREIADPPFLLYAKGNVKCLHKQTMAVVGSRKHTHYGSQIVETLVPSLAIGGVVVVSGLAYGIDALAHRATLKAGQQTAAVVACGLDRIYPSDHMSLAEEIIKKDGVIISEYALGTPPLKQHFPARNRIIAGVSSGTLIVECDVQSGAMITAHHALEQNRDVFAVPGPITSPLSAGPNALLRMGAIPVVSVSDLLDYLGLAKNVALGNRQAIDRTLSKLERAVFELLSNEPLHVDSLVEASKLEMAEINSALLFLEVKGLIKNVGAANYVKR